MKEVRLPLAQLDREDAELLPIRETLFGDVNVNTVISVNLALAFAGIADEVNAVAGQLLSFD